MRESEPFHGKGKAPDPRNWGGANLSDEDLDIEAQRAALNSFKAAQMEAESSEEGDGTTRTYKTAQEWARGSNKKDKKDHSQGGQHHPNKPGVPRMEVADNPMKSRKCPTGRDCDPVRALADHTLGRISSPRERRTTPKAMDPVRQVAPKSYV
ncbi:hypothetical protein CY34DRAFT_100292, partial [Suillus luteus UH-Slu-Lm8-n1]